MGSPPGSPHSLHLPWFKHQRRFPSGPLGLAANSWPQTERSKGFVGKHARRAAGKASGVGELQKEGLEARDDDRVRLGSASY